MRYWIVPVLLVLASLSPSAVAAEPPVDMTAAQVAEAVAAAPKVPVDLGLGLGLKLKLVDYIDCTQDAGPRPMMDQGTSEVVTGPAGTYRVTAEHRHAFFAYRWRSGGQDKPHVLVVEYPDDAKRTIMFFTHESKISGRKNIDWSLETGIYAGNPMPNTGGMQYHTMFFWPNDEWPVVMVGNWNRSGAPAGASRIWVYQVEGGLPALDTDDPDPADPRMIGDLYNWSRVPVHGAFGLTDRTKTFDHIAEYYAYLGQNMVSWPVVVNNRWGFKCRIDAWDGNDDNDELAGILAACEKHGVKFVASFDMGRGFTIDGKKPTPENRTAYREGLKKGFSEFIDRYGASPALYGIAFGSPDFGPPYADATLDIIRECFDGDLGAFTSFIHSKKPDLKVYTFVGAEDLHRQWFDDAPGVMARWEKSGGPWGQHLADEALALWKTWKRDPAELAKAPHLTTVHQYQPDDHAIYDSYSQQGRSMMYHDLDASAAKAANIDSRAVMLWNTFFEGWFGLHPDENFWYLKLWVAPDANASEPYASAPLARVMEHRDRNFIISGSWNRKAGGREASLRRFAQAYRSLPPIEMIDVPVQSGATVQVRRGVYEGKTYASVLNTTPFDAVASLMIGEELELFTLDPFQLKTTYAEGDVLVTAQTRPAAEYIEWLKGRLAEYKALGAEVAELNPAAAPDAYKEHGRRAAELLEEGKYRAADLALGHGLTAELALRKRILAPPTITVPRIDAAVPMNGSLDGWPAEATTIDASDASYLAGFLYFHNAWDGPEDLSATVRLAHDGDKLYIGIDVLDSKLVARDALNLHFSPANYRNVLATEKDQSKYEMNFSISLPIDQATTESTNAKQGFGAVAKRTDRGYTVTAELDLTRLDLSDNRLGYIFQIADHEDSPATYTSRWAKDSILLIPNAPAFSYWMDARSCGELILE